MYRLLVVNPNTTASMTEKIAAAARTFANSETKIIATNSANGPASIQGYFDVATCIPGLLAEVKRYTEIDGVLVACFDDTGVDALRCLLDVPVIGIGEAAYHAASMVSVKFSVSTTLSRSVPGLENNLSRYGLMQKCAKVRASDIPVLELERGVQKTVDIIRDEIRKAIDEDGAEAIVLGCAGMVDLVSKLSDEFGMPIIEGISCGVAMLESLLRAGLTTSKIKSYASP